jgi:hypothetical protein
LNETSTDSPRIENISSYRRVSHILLLTKPLCSILCEPCDWFHVVFPLAKKSQIGELKIDHIQVILKPTSTYTPGMLTMAQLIPFNPPLGVFPQFCFPQENVLHMKEKAFSLGDDFTIKTAAGVELFKCKGKILSISDKKGE